MLLELGDAIRAILQTRGIDVVSSAAATSDYTTTMALRLVNGPDDADQEGRTSADGSGACDVAVTLVHRSNVGGNTRWLASTSETAQAALATLRNTTVGGIPVAWVRFDYSADLGIGDKGRPEASDNFMVRCSRAALA